LCLLNFCDPREGGLHLGRQIFGEVGCRKSCEVIAGELDQQQHGLGVRILVDLAKDTFEVGSGSGDRLTHDATVTDNDPSVRRGFDSGAHGVKTRDVTLLGAVNRFGMLPG
jgi:hypothetical protein